MRVCVGVWIAGGVGRGRRRKHEPISDVNKLKTIIKACPVLLLKSAEYFTL